MVEVNIIDVNDKNILKYPPRCFINVNNEGHKQKESWVRDQFKQGMKIKILTTKDTKKMIGYIEYIPGEFAWRAIDAKNQMVIHCIWISPKKHREQGLGSLLINECVKDAEKQGLSGVAVIASADSFMAGKEVFLKNNFSIVDQDEPFSLLLKEFNKAKKPSFCHWKEELAKYQGLHIVYSHQCSWVARFMYEMKNRLDELNIRKTELKTAKQAQQAPSIYSTFNFISDGKLLADHYISERRFENIIKNEISSK